MRIFYSRLFRTGKEFEKFEYSIIRHSREHSSSLKYLGFSRWKIVSKFEFTRRERIFFFLLLFNILYRGGRTKRIERSEFVFSVKIYNVEKKVHKFSKDNQGYYESGYNAIKQI